MDQATKHVLNDMCAVLTRSRAQIVENPHLRKVKNTYESIIAGWIEELQGQEMIDAALCALAPALTVRKFVPARTEWKARAAQ